MSQLDPTIEEAYEILQTLEISPDPELTSNQGFEANRKS